MSKMNPERISLVNPEVVVTHPASSSGLSGGGGGGAGTFASSGTRAKVFVSAVLGVTATAALVLVAVGGGARGGLGGVWSGVASRLGSAAGSGGSGDAGSGGFPEVRVFVNPKEAAHLKAVKENWEHYHRGGSSAVTPLMLPDLRKWPKAGGYPEITGLIGMGRARPPASAFAFALAQYTRKSNAFLDFTMSLVLPLMMRSM